MNSSKLLLAVVALYLLCFLSCGQRVKTGQIFKTVTIGNQVWMAENLNVNTFRNGDPIPEVKTDEEWIKAGYKGKPAWCYYDNDPANGKIYGKLYNWYAVNDPRGLAPEGWHVPTNTEWKELEIYLGMNSLDADEKRWRGTDEGGKLKETGTTHWKSPNTGATDESGFSALPGGSRDDSYGNFYSMETQATFWSYTEYDSDNADYWRLSYDHSDVYRGCYYYKHYGISVRCVRYN